MNCHRMKSNYDGKIAGLYDLEESIGKGHYAVVKVARHVFTGEKVAVKVIDKNRLDEISRAHLFQEVRCMKLVQHQHVVRLYEVIDTQTKLYLVLELGDGGDLYDYIMKQQHGLSEAEASYYFAQIVDAISYCHQLHVVHRDLKPENVIFFNKSKKVKVTDFGFSNCFIPGRKLDTSCGSLAYSAPEILLGDAYDAPSVDVWSLGVILYMLVCGKPPFQEANDSETLIRIMDCNYTTPEHVSLQCVELLRGMLQRDPTKRMSMSSISQHPWLSVSHVPRHPATPLVTLNGVVNKLLPLVNNKTRSSSSLVSSGTLTDDEHSFITQKMIDGQIASRDEIIRSLLCTYKFNGVHLGQIQKYYLPHGRLQNEATYFLLAERLLRKRNTQVSNGSPLKNSEKPRVPSTNGVHSNSTNHSNNVPATKSAKNTSPGVGNLTQCLVIEEICEEESDDCHEDEPIKDATTTPSVNKPRTLGDLHQSKPSNDLPSPSKQGASRSLYSVNSMPQLILNQISEEDEDDETSQKCDVVQARRNDAKRSVISDRLRKLTNKNRIVAPVSSNAADYKNEKDPPSCVARQSDSRRHYAVSEDEEEYDDDDISVLGGHRGLSGREIRRQSSLFQTTCDADCEVSTTMMPYGGTTNSLDRRHFQHQKKPVKPTVSSAGRSFVGAVKKSFSAILGHFSAVGDVPSAKPSSLDTWGSCGSLSQQVIRESTKDLLDRHRVAGCQFARELRQNRSDHGSSFTDVSKTRISSTSSSSNVIRVRSRDFSTLKSKFTSDNQT